MFDFQNIGNGSDSPTAGSDSMKFLDSQPRSRNDMSTHDYPNVVAIISRHDPSMCIRVAEIEIPPGIITRGKDGKLNILPLE